MAVINIGAGATDRASLIGSNTFVDNTTPANGTGTITTIEIWAASTSLAGCWIATFFVVSGNNLSTRDSEIIQIIGQDPGVVPHGSKQTATVDLEVVEGDYIGVYFSDGYLELDTDGAGAWVGSPSNDYIPCENVTFLLYGEREISLYGTGTTEVAVKKKNVIFMGSNF